MEPYDFGDSAGSTTAELAADFEAIFKAAQTWSVAVGPDQVGLSSIACGAATVLDRIQKTSLPKTLRRANLPATIER